MTQTYEIEAHEADQGATVVVRDENGIVTRRLDALSSEHAQKLAVDCALLASQEPGVAVVIPSNLDGS